VNNLINIEKTLKINLLLDFYYPLLTKKQLDYMQLYFKEDLSLQEIASIHNVSRNAVYDTIQRSIKQLDNYELKLQLLSKYNKRQEIIRIVRDEFNDNKIINKYLKQLEDID